MWRFLIGGSRAERSRRRQRARVVLQLNTGAFSSGCAHLGGGLAEFRHPYEVVASESHLRPELVPGHAAVAQLPSSGDGL